MNARALDAYRRRIGDDGPLAPDLPTLRRLHRRHMLAIPFENLDPVRGVPVSADPSDAFAKIVERGRGGWCFEMNGLFGEVLDSIGFAVDQVGAKVAADEPGEITHRALIVHLEGPWLADVGFGFGPLEPLPLREGATDLAGGTFRLSKRGETWRLQPPGEAPYYVFVAAAQTQAAFDTASRVFVERKAAPLFTAPFVVRALDDGYISLRDAQFRHWSGGAVVEERELEGPAAVRDALIERFALPDDLTF